MIKRSDPALIDLHPNPTIRIDNIRERRFNLIDRSPYCPLCQTRVPDLSEHCAEMAGDHIAMAIHNS